MHYRTLVSYAPQQVHGSGDQGNDGEDTAGAKGLLWGEGTTAGGLGAGLEEVRAFVWRGADERDVRG